MPAVRRRLACLGAVVAVAIAVAGCGSATPATPLVGSPSPIETAASPSGTGPPAASASGSPDLTPVPTASGAASGSPAPTTVAQTDTSWGRIWDALPAGFPRYPGATDSGSGDVASGSFVANADAATVATWMTGALRVAGYSTVDSSGPLEDGSRVIESVGATAGCRVRTTVRPLGGVTMIDVLFGAKCRFS